MKVRRWLPLLVWSTGLVLGTWFFHGLGQAELAAPPLDPAGWGEWAAARAPAVAVIAVLRLVVLGLCWYLVGVTTIGLTGRLLRAARLVRYADTLTLPWLRRLLQQGLGLALATAMVTGAAGASGARASHAEGGAAAAGGAAVTLSAAGGQPRVSDLEGVGEPLPLPLRLLAPEVLTDPQREGPNREARGREVAGGLEIVAGSDSAVGIVSDVEVETEPAPVRAHVVRTGDSLWRIAAQELSEVLGHAPSDAEVVPYWQRVIEQNRAGLPDPDDPDLILPGQRVELPPLPEG